LIELLPPEDPHNLELTREYIRSGFRVLDRESHEVDIHGNPKVFLNSMIGVVENGMLVRTWGIQRDITEKVKLEESRKKTEEALRRSEERLRVALSGSPIEVFNQDRDLRYTWVYNPHEGWTEEDYLGKTDEEIFDPETAARMAAIKRPVLETGRGTRQEFTLSARGKTYHCDMTVEPLLDAKGQVVGVNCACVDITHLREVTEELRLAKEKLAEEKLYLEQAIDTELGFGEIIGRSRVLKEVMDKVAKVAPSDATVLLLGETGTGKELVARAIHRLSHRKDNSFIKLNCAAIPSGLLESELFGHEKGAFTGAVARKLGRLELADRGTLFLDEIGEIPLELQPKLLRVLQDQEFERLGGTQTLKVNFRLLAATNRELLESVRHHEFRSDLYYRLNVFPIRIPPLRERREDIRLLVEHFVRKYASRMNKSITSIPAKTIEALAQWAWPGNIRELENFLERSVILTPGSVLQAPLSELQTAADEGNRGSSGTLREQERERVLRVLRECNGQLGGPDGAAARLGLKRTTLQSKLSHLGIKPGTFRK
jgi:PAS domain S-box-containing protein